MKHSTHLLRFLIFAVLHRVVYVAEDCFDGVRLCQVQRKEGHERVVLNLVTL